jgi:hypothetical protein
VGSFMFSMTDVHSESHMDGISNNKCLKRPQHSHEDILIHIIVCDLLILTTAIAGGQSC